MLQHQGPECPALAQEAGEFDNRVQAHGFPDAHPAKVLMIVDGVFLGARNR